ALTGQAAQEEMSVQVFLKALSEPPNARLVHYDPSNKRDPFRPFDLSEKMRLDVARTPLQGVDVKELALTAVVEQSGEAKAVIETPDGQGHTVKKGDKVGLNGGEIVEISPDRIVVLESMQDFTGETKTKTVEILRKGQTRETAQGARKKPSRS
ncbi:MAG: pilus assembly protein PilP, partial [SAR324 cluster bacterium]|nr:pilus assembly protein PilP [SAR324 cluster bacterium]